MNSLQLTLRTEVVHQNLLKPREGINGRYYRLMLNNSLEDRKANIALIWKIKLKYFILSRQEHGWSLDTNYTKTFFSALDVTVQNGMYNIIHSASLFRVFSVLI